MIGAAGIEAVGVVVPAHNEETLLPACLMALWRAADGIAAPVYVLVVADTCTDKTVAAAHGARGAGDQHPAAAASARRGRPGWPNCSG